MPAYAEENVLGAFLEGLAAAFRDLPLAVVVVDDCSPDATSRVAEAVLQAVPGRHRVVRNLRNGGHGVSTRRGLALALALDPEIVVAVDGDAAFLPADVRRVAEACLNGTVDVVEGVRHRSGDPAYRQLVSRLTCWLVFLRSGRRPMDANTPLRAYRPSALAALLEGVPGTCPIPNLLISSLSRTSGLAVVQVPVAALARPGSESGTTWGQSLYRGLPSRRFIAFCARAVVAWLLSPRQIPRSPS